MIDLTQLQHCVGRERSLVDELRPFPAQALAAALDRADVPSAGDLLPPGWQWLYFLDAPTTAATGRDGHPQLDAASFLPPMPLPRRMWAAGKVIVDRPLQLGHPASRHSVIRSVDAKSGKSGELAFVTLEHRFEQFGQVCVREEQNLVYREMPSGPAPLPPGEPAPVEADWTQKVTPDPVLLFRYSALTYNAHRIHYDRDYAVRQEHYPTLVVHGPLLATLLIELVRKQLPDERITSFRFRALRPSFDSHPFRICARREDRQLKLWSADHEGFLCMSAEAELA